MNDEFDHIFIAPKDFDAALRFYQEVLGWEVEYDWGEEGEPRGAAMKSAGNMRVVIAEQHEASKDHSQNEGYFGSSPTIYVRTDDVDARFRSLSSKDSVVIAPENTHWGIRWFVLRDPDGNLVAFCGPEKEQ